MSITGIVFFISRLQDERIARIGELAGTNVYRQKATVFRYEFNQLLNGTADASNFIAATEDRIDADELQADLAALLFADARVTNAWYAIAGPQDTSYVYLSRTQNGYRSGVLPVYLKRWAGHRLVLPDTSLAAVSKVVAAGDAVHWLTASRVSWKRSGQLVLGLDVDLKALQRTFYLVDEKAFSYAFIIDEEGLCISHPEESMIGRHLSNMDKSAVLMHGAWDGNVRHEETLSEYLKIPVTRYFVPSGIVGTNWTTVVDVPKLVVDEDVEAIHTYSIYMGLLAIAIILGLTWLYQQKWQKEFLLRRQVEINEAEQQKDNALLQLDKLKEKVNPHFLFNSLSSLNALIAQDTKMAQLFVLKLSRVYRYVLEASPNGLATVEEELRFVNEYFFLMKIRFGDALLPLELAVPDADQSYKLPFMSLQTLVENAVKHNKLSKEKPLKISIKSNGTDLVVTNNLQLRTDVGDSGKQGLNYLQSTYIYFGDRHLKYGIEGDDYVCYLPLLP
ncbi:histidine kinase [Pedobacter sp. BAL39]|uniref:histidine kinase n=1 Tax=Pedobacter sp. BAL39 TaxID=391596 RepID=UPI0012FA8E9D|nr:histidine kinase [Pedobacter sp. BAL39]